MKTSGLKKHSFWLLFGAVPLLVGLGVLMILSSVGGATAERKKEYDTQKTEIAGAKPKGKGVGVELSKQKGQLDTKVTALWGENFQQQKVAGLFKWPNTLRADTELAKLEKRNLPFGDDFLVPADKEAVAGAPRQYYLDANQTELAEFAAPNVYQKAYKDMADKVFPTRFGRGGPAAPAGGEEGPRGPGPGGPGMAGPGLQNNQGDGWQAVLRHVTEWGTTAKPTVPELWLALEDIWVQRELLAVVERTNKALTRFEPEFAFWNYNPLKRTFVSRLWAIDLEVVTEASRKYLKATVRNPNDRLQMLGASKVMRLKVWLDNPSDAQPSLPDYVIGGELVPGRGTMDVPLQKTDPRNKVLPGSHRIGIAVDAMHICACGQHRIAADAAPVHHDRAQPDKRPVLKHTAMHHRHMPDQHIVADQCRKALRMAGARAVAMDHAAILHVGARADNDAVHIGADHAIVPDTCICADLDIADDPAPRRDKCAVVDTRGLAMQADDRDVVHHAHPFASNRAACAA